MLGTLFDLFSRIDERDPARSMIQDLSSLGQILRSPKSASRTDSTLYPERLKAEPGRSNTRTVTAEFFGLEYEIGSAYDQGRDSATLDSRWSIITA
jgi:hypothetical protein